MTEIVRNVSGKGQVTLPVEVRRALGIKAPDQVAFEIEAGEVKVKAAGSRFDELYQSVPALPKKLAWKQVEHVAMEDMAGEVAKEGL